MRKSSRQALAALLCFGIPFLAVRVARRQLGPLQETPTARQKGHLHAKVLIVEYSDFQCPACASVQPAVQQLMETHKGSVRLAFKHFPLSKIHKNAVKAAHAAECAAQQNQFWPYHDRLFAAQQVWRDLPDPTPSFITFAADLHFDTRRFSECLKDPSRLLLIQSDIAEGKQRFVNTTPTFFVNEERLVGQVFTSEADKVIQRALHP
ncbi:MAG: thioredoxin domain-containing protein [Elusimicrobia bacterium]|nr:thioredoxin domain-containing protein [Elusimicrobiota bacterium]